jgi:drug/metabolite transporter (DMT)-like permease
MMRFIKIAFAIFLLVLGLLVIVGQVSHIRHHSGAAWHQYAGTILFVSSCVCGAYLLLRRLGDPVAGVHCPRCMALGGHAPAPQYGSSINFLVWHFGGFLLSIFYSGSKRQRFRCRGCGELFHAHTALSRGYRILFLLIVALIVNRIWAELSEIWGQ